MDLSDNGSECEGISNRTPPFDGVSSDGSNLKTCVDCGTSKTPLWRGGPDGPKSLCNACGIRSRKKRRVLMGVTKEEKKIKKCPSLSPRGHNSSSNSGGHSCSTSSSGGDGGDSFPLKNRPWGGGSHLGLQKPRSNTNRKKKLGEEEQAAFLLLALSCGSVYG